jgi:23S rRNA (uracil1939-C5)-methyltransferase
MRLTASCGRSTKRKPTANTAIGPGTVTRVTFTDLLANGQAVGRIDGRIVVFVNGALPGERARIRITAAKAKYLVGEILALETQSPFRVAPFCSVFGICGGCQVQHLSYPAQLSWKEQIVRSALRRIGGLGEVDVRHPVGMTYPRAYRNKMSLVVQHGAAGTKLGFYQARSHALVPITQCPVVLPRLDRAIGILQELAAPGTETAAAFAGVKHATMRLGASSGQSVLSLTTDRSSSAIAERAASLARHIPGVVGVSNSFEPRNANSVLGRRISYLWGARETEEVIDDVRFRVSPASFFQVNSEMVGKIFRYMAPGLFPGCKVVDLYCGAGTFAIFFAMRGASVVGIEENPAAVREARANAELNGVADRASFIEGRVEGSVASEAGKKSLAQANIVFLDPPRKGSDEATLDAVSRAKVDAIWYLSCNPATLARDLAYLVRFGYQVGVAQPFDMFPQTGHVETLVTLYRSGSGGLTLPDADRTPWGDQIPEWPSDERFAQDVYPDFVEPP